MRTKIATCQIVFQQNSHLSRGMSRCQERNISFDCRIAEHSGRLSSLASSAYQSGWTACESERISQMRSAKSLSRVKSSPISRSYQAHFHRHSDWHGPCSQSLTYGLWSGLFVQDKRPDSNPGRRDRSPARPTLDQVAPCTTPATPTLRAAVEVSHVLW